MNLALKSFPPARVAGVDPLFLVSTARLELTAVSSQAPLFDTDGDLFAEPTGWVKGDDGLLALDANGNGRIDDVSELFGNASISGFAELALLDANADGRIDAADAAFADLRVWRDADGDAVTDAGELHGLTALGIASIGLAAQASGASNALTWWRAPAASPGRRHHRTVGDVRVPHQQFQQDLYRRQHRGSGLAATMPNLKGHGTLADLHVSLTG